MIGRIAVVALVLATVALAGCRVDEMRSDFVALRYVQEAEAHLHELPRNTAGGERALDRAVALMPDDNEMRARAARLYVAARAWEKAARLFEAQPELSRQDRTMLGYCLLKLGDRERGAELCLEVIREAEQLRAQGSISRREWALLLNDGGYLLVDTGAEIAVGYEAVQRATEVFPLEAPLVDSLGWALLRKGEFLDAAFYLERARRLHSREDPEMLYHLGVAYARLERYGQAKRALQRAAELDPGFADVQKELRRLGRILPPPALAMRPTSAGA